MCNHLTEMGPVNPHMQIQNVKQNCILMCWHKAAECNGQWIPKSKRKCKIGGEHNQELDSILFLNMATDKNGLEYVVHWFCTWHIIFNKQSIGESMTLEHGAMDLARTIDNYIYRRQAMIYICIYVLSRWQLLSIEHECKWRCNEHASMWKYIQHVGWLSLDQDESFTHKMKVGQSLILKRLAVSGLSSTSTRAMFIWCLILLNKSCI